MSVNCAIAESRSGRARSGSPGALRRASQRTGTRGAEGIGRQAWERNAADLGDTVTKVRSFPLLAGTSFPVRGGV